MSGLYRTGDPDTSKQAAGLDTTSLEALVLKVLAERGDQGATIDELVASLSLDKVTLSPRLRPLCNKKLAKESGQKRPGASGRNQTVWVAA